MLHRTECKCMHFEWEHFSDFFVHVRTNRGRARERLSSEREPLSHVLLLFSTFVDQEVRPWGSFTIIHTWCPICGHRCLSVISRISGWFRGAGLQGAGFSMGLRPRLVTAMVAMVVAIDRPLPTPPASVPTVMAYPYTLVYDLWPLFHFL